eukprot:scaffold93405_cov28-Prasinocladus_malaysianus.AAC.8
MDSGRMRRPSSPRRACVAFIAAMCSVTSFEWSPTSSAASFGVFPVAMWAIKRCTMSGNPGNCFPDKVVRSLDMSIEKERPSKTTAARKPRRQPADKVPTTDGFPAPTQAMAPPPKDQGPGPSADNQVPGEDDGAQQSDAVAAGGLEPSDRETGPGVDAQDAGIDPPDVPLVGRKRDPKPVMDTESGEEAAEPSTRRRRGYGNKYVKVYYINTKGGGKYQPDSSQSSDSDPETPPPRRKPARKAAADRGRRDAKPVAATPKLDTEDSELESDDGSGGTPPAAPIGAVPTYTFL